MLQRLFVIVLGLSATLSAEFLPGRFVVELTAQPAGELARPAASFSARAARRAVMDSEQRTVARLATAAGARVLAAASNVMNALMVDIGSGDPQMLAALPGVVKVYPVETMRLELDHALPLHSVPAAWAAVGGRERAGAGVKIAILDSGIDPDHPAFQDTALRPPPGYPLASPDANLRYTSGKIIVARDYNSFYSLREPQDVRDRLGHGTAVAMCAAGVPNQGPFAFITGVAPKAWLGVYKVGPAGTGIASDAILKGVDDALADGMDVLNLSIGSALVPRIEDSALMTGLERAARFGMVVVVSAGNSGPAAGTTGSSATAPSVISAGASENDRLLLAAVEATGVGQRSAVPSAGDLPETPVSAPLRGSLPADACGALPSGSLEKSIGIAIRGTCTFEVKLQNMERAGAVAGIIYTASASDPPITMAVGQAKLPAVMVGFDDGRALLAAAAASPDLAVKITFEGVPAANDPARVSSYSSRGPTYDFRIKPDVAATGYVYTAAEKIDETGDVYDPSGYTAVSGTSFASPIVAGAAAVLRAARPGLTVDQYRSLLINRASPIDVKGFGLERVQRAGPGSLNLEASVQGTVAAYPTSVSYGVGSGTSENSELLLLTNIGKTADTYTLRTIRYDGAAPLRFADNARGLGAAETMTLRIEPGQSKSVYPFWTFNRAPAGEYQGLILAEGAQPGSSILVPYWFAVPSGVPAEVTVVSPPPAQLPVGQTANIYFRLPDEAGVPVTAASALRYSGTVVGGGGAISAVSASGTYPNLVFVQIRSGPSPAVNTYRVVFGSLPALTFTVQGVSAAP